MASKTNKNLILEQYNDPHNKNNLICPRCISNSLKIWVKTKKDVQGFNKLNLLSKEIAWIIDENKLLEKNPLNQECSVCGNKSVYIKHNYFLKAIAEIMRLNEIPKSNIISHEFKSYFKMNS